MSEADARAEIEVWKQRRTAAAEAGDTDAVLDARRHIAKLSELIRRLQQEAHRGQAVPRPTSQP